jgi:hypothetical protein
MTEQEELTAAIYRIRWVDGIKNSEMVSDQGIAKALLELGWSKN